MFIDSLQERRYTGAFQFAEIHGLFAGGAGPLLGPASSVSEISAPGGQLLFLYVLEAGVYRADPIFHSGQLFFAPCASGAIPGPKSLCLLPT